LQSLFELGRPAPGEEALAEEHIEALISAGTEEGIIEEGDRELIQSVVAFGDKTVRDVLTPRPRVIAISQDATLDALRELAIHEQYSRIPAYDGDIDSITGFVHVRDMFELNEEADGSYVVSGSVDLGRLGDLLEFRPPEGTESTTVGGLITEWLGHVPVVGEEVERDGIQIKVLASNNLRVDQVRVAKAAEKS